MFWGQTPAASTATSRVWDEGLQCCPGVLGAWEVSGARGCCHGALYPQVGVILCAHRGGCCASRCRHTYVCTCNPGVHPSALASACACSCTCAYLYMLITCATHPCARWCPHVFLSLCVHPHRCRCVWCTCRRPVCTCVCKSSPRVPVHTPACAQLPCAHSGLLVGASPPRPNI